MIIAYKIFDLQNERLLVNLFSAFCERFIIPGGITPVSNSARDEGSVRRQANKEENQTASPQCFEK